jgi:hypothetical protein
MEVDSSFLVIAFIGGAFAFAVSPLWAPSAAEGAGNGETGVATVDTAAFGGRSDARSHATHASAKDANNATCPFRRIVGSEGCRTLVVPAATLIGLAARRQTIVTFRAIASPFEKTSAKLHLRIQYRLAGDAALSDAV